MCWERLLPNVRRRAKSKLQSCKTRIITSKSDLIERPRNNDLYNFFKIYLSVSVNLAMKNTRTDLVFNRKETEHFLTESATKLIIYGEIGWTQMTLDSMETGKNLEDSPSHRSVKTRQGLRLEELMVLPISWQLIFLKSSDFGVLMLNKLTQVVLTLKSASAAQNTLPGQIVLRLTMLGPVGKIQILQTKLGTGKL